MDTDKSLPHVVVIGGGFGGLRAARCLKDAAVRVTLIDRANHHLFQPLLYQVAMAGLSPAEIAYPIRSVFRKQRNVNVVMSEVVGVELASRTVRIRDGDEREFPYDYLVVASGSQNNYFGHDDWAEYAVGLKNLDDAIEIRRRVLLAFEAAERESVPEKRIKLLTFVVIGGGPTGVELAGSLAELARFVLSSDFRVVKPSEARVILLEGFQRVLPAFPEDLSASARAQLERLGVEVRTSTLVTDISADGVELHGEFIPSVTVLWCAGVAPTPIARCLGVSLDQAGRILVEPDLSLAGHPEVFAVGDIAAFLHQDGKPLPGLAPVAMQQGAAVAEAIRADLAGKPRPAFHYVHKGSLATIGRSAAVADFGRVKMSGFLAWMSWLLVHIFFLIGFRNRFMVMFDWLWGYITYQRGARLITGGRLKPGAPLEGTGRPPEKVDKVETAPRG